MLPKNTRKLCFEKDGFFRIEFNNLDHSLLNNANYHVEVISTLSKNESGLNRKSILESVSMKDGGGFSEVLYELEHWEFLESYSGKLFCTYCKQQV